MQVAIRLLPFNKQIRAAMLLNEYAGRLARSRLFYRSRCTPYRVIVQQEAFSPQHVQQPRVLDNDRLVRELWFEGAESSIQVIVGRMVEDDEQARAR